MQTTSVNPREEHREFWANNLTLPIDDPFWDKHRPGDQWNCKCWLEQTDAPRTALEDMPDSADIPEPKAGLRGNTAKTKEIFSQDHPHFPNKCATCHLNTDGKVHGIKDDKTVKNAIKGNCDNCIMSNCSLKKMDEESEKKHNAYIEHRREEFRKYSREEYNDLEFNENTGAFKGIHKKHEIHNKKNDKRFFEGLTTTDLEIECMNVLYKNGHSCILREEGAKDSSGRCLSSLDAYIDGILADIRSITPSNKKWKPIPDHFRNQIADKNHQLERWHELKTNPQAETICLYFHDMSFYSDERVIKGYQHYLEDIFGDGRHYYKKNFVKKIICVGRNGFFKVFEF